MNTSTKTIWLFPTIFFSLVLFITWIFLFTGLYFTGFIISILLSQVISFFTLLIADVINDLKILPSNNKDNFINLGFWFFKLWYKFIIEIFKVAIKYYLIIVIVIIVIALLILELLSFIIKIL